MKTNIIELYGPDELAREKRRLLVWIVVLVLAAALVLAACIVLCTHVTQRNWQRMLTAVLLTSVLGGWTVLSLRIFVLDQIRFGEKHVAAIEEHRAERERFEGTFTLTNERLLVKNGVSMQRVQSDNPKAGVLQLYRRKVKRFDAARAAAVYVEFGFITAYEVCDADS